mgnify:CR=1 FL=1
MLMPGSAVQLQGSEQEEQCIISRRVPQLAETQASCGVGVPGPCGYHVVFLDHVVFDTYRFGPPRGYWCMAFEAFNGIVKRAANRSNFKNELLSLMVHWSMKSAICMSERRSAQEFWDVKDE